MDYFVRINEYVYAFRIKCDNAMFIKENEMVFSNRVASSAFSTQLNYIECAHRINYSSKAIFTLNWFRENIHLIAFYILL